jgi:hypothetical protein
MDSEFWQKLRWWRESTVDSLRKHRWYLPALMGIVWGAAEHRFYGALNQLVDEHVIASLKPLVLGVVLSGFWKAVGIGFACSLVVIIGLLVHAYVVSAKSHAITGTADKLVLNLDNHAFTPAPDWSSFTADLGVFIHARVTVTDRPRTVTKFVFSAANPGKDGKEYKVDSEREIGRDYYHQFHKEVINEAGYRVVMPFCEPVPNLLERLQTPLLPYTHADGWMRFELKDVDGKVELNDCKISIYAADARDNLYEISTVGMKFAPLKDREYIFKQSPKASVAIPAEATLKDRVVGMAHELFAFLKDRGPEPPDPINHLQSTDDQWKKVWERYDPYVERIHHDYLRLYRDRVVNMFHELAAQGIEIPHVKESEIDPTPSCEGG